MNEKRDKTAPKASKKKANPLVTAKHKARRIVKRDKMLDESNSRRLKMLIESGHSPTGLRHIPTRKLARTLRRERVCKMAQEAVEREVASQEELESGA